MISNTLTKHKIRKRYGLILHSKAKLDMKITERDFNFFFMELWNRIISDKYDTNGRLKDYNIPIEWCSLSNFNNLFKRKYRLLLASSYSLRGLDYSEKILNLKNDKILNEDNLIFLPFNMLAFIKGIWLDKMEDIPIIQKNNKTNKYFITIKIYGKRKLIKNFNSYDDALIYFNNIFKKECDKQYTMAKLLDYPEQILNLIKYAKLKREVSL